MWGGSSFLLGNKLASRYLVQFQGVLAGGVEVIGCENLTGLGVSTGRKGLAFRLSNQHLLVDIFGGALHLRELNLGCDHMEWGEFGVVRGLGPHIGSPEEMDQVRLGSGVLPWEAEDCSS